MSLSKSENKQRQDHLDGKADLLEIRAKESHFFVIHGQHFSLEAVQYFKKFQTIVSQDPESWIFMLEGGESESSDAVPELAVAKNIAEAKNIPIIDPLVSVTCPAVWLRAVQQHPELRNEIIQFALAMSVSKVENRTHEEITTRVLGITSQEYEDRLAYFFVNPGEKRIVLDPNIHSLVLTTANDVNTAILRYCLRKYPKRKKVLMYMGSDHVDVVYSLLKPTNNTSISDAEVESILNLRRRIDEETVKRRIPPSRGALLAYYGIQV